MGKMKVIHKGMYPFPRDNEYVRLLQYIIVDEDGEKYALLRFVNDDNATVKGLKIKFEQVGADGSVVSGGVYECGGLNVKSKQKFAFGEKIKIDKDCFDFKVKVLSVDFGKFVYNSFGANKGLSYVKTEPAKRAHAGAYAAKEKKLRISVILTTLFCGVMLAASAAITISVNNYKSTEDGFILQNVNYAFADEYKKDDVVVTGYRGKASRVDIPEKAGGHKVVKIEEYAFKNKSTVNRVVIKGAPTIEAGAFLNCSGLEKIDLGGVTDVGEQAFYGCVSLKSVSSEKLTAVGEKAFARCESLTSVSIKHDGVLVLGERAFENCRKLNDVNLNCFIDYTGGGAGKFFNGCGTIDKMYLKNYNYLKYGYLSQNGGYSALFGGMSVSVDGAAELTVGYTDKIFASMLSGNKALKTFTVENIENGDIADKAFYGCENLTAVNLAVLPTVIGAEAFADTKLTAVDLSKVTAIGKKAFYGCGSLVCDLQKATVLTDIGESAFSGCTSIKKVYFSPTIVRIGAGAFSGCTSLREANGLNKLKMTALPKSVFEGCESLYGVALPQNMTIIGTAAFKNCKAMTAFVAPESLTTVSDEAFAGCAALKTIDLKENVEAVGAGAFSGCTSIENIEIGDSLKTIGAGAFAGDESLLTLTLPDFRNAATLKNLFGGSYDAGIPQSLKTVTLTNAVSLSSGAFADAEALEEVIIRGDYDKSVSGVFSGATGLKRLTLPYFGTAYNWFGDVCNLETVSVTNESVIENGAFRDCVKLKTVNYAQDLTAVGSSAFSGCVRLEKFVLPRITPTIGADAFANCFKLYEVIDKSGNVTKGGSGYGGIAYYAVKVYSDETDAPEKSVTDGYKIIFDEDSSAWIYASYDGDGTELIFPAEIINLKGETVDAFRIADYLLYNEDKITSVSFGNVDYLGKFAFYGCEAVTGVTFGDGSDFNAVGEHAFAGCVNLVEANMPSVRTVGDYAFNGCEKLESVSFSLDAVGEDAFSGCVRLHEVKNAGTLNLEAGSVNNGEIARYAIGVYTDLNKGLKVKTVNDVKFKSDDGDTWYATSFGGSGVANIGISDGSKIIVAPYAFEKNNDVTALITDGKLSGIAENSFIECENLATVDLSASTKLTALKRNSFVNLNGLKTLALPSGLTTLSYGAFTGCGSVEKLTLPLVGDLENGEIGNLFGLNNYSLGALTDVTVNGGAGISSVVFRGVDSLKTVTVSSLDVKSVGDSAFAGLTNLTSVKLSSGVTSIGINAFNSCVALSSIDFNDNTAEIGESAFYNCAALTSVKLPKNLTVVSPNAFEACGSLATVTFPQKLTEIGDSAFSLTSLKSVDLSSTVVKKIGNSAFFGINSLDEVIFPSSLQSIGNYAFKETALTELNLSSTIVSSIGLRAFYGTPLTKAAFPQTLYSVGKEAFYGCTSLWQVNDLSRRLSKGSSGYGYAAYYAVGVFNNSSSSLTIITSGNGKFAKDASGNWFLCSYDFDSVGTLILPESFSYNSQTITRYAIHKYAFKNYVDSMVITSGVTSIDGEAFGSGVPSRVYYGGTESAWSTLSKPSFEYSNVYYYDECAHESGQWKFVSSSPKVGPFEINSSNGKKVVGKEATCTQDGYYSYVCGTCGKSSVKFVALKLGHDLTHYPAKEPGENELYGNIEYWYCNRCEKYFKDKDGKNEISKNDTRWYKNKTV